MKIDEQKLRALAERTVDGWHVGREGDLARAVLALLDERVRLDAVLHEQFMRIDASRQSVIDHISRERDAARAECEAMRPVVEAALALDCMDYSAAHNRGCGQDSQTTCVACRLDDAINTYRTYRVARSKAMKVIRVSNFDYEDERGNQRVIATGLEPEVAEVVANRLNGVQGENSDDFYVTRPDDYVLPPDWEP